MTMLNRHRELTARLRSVKYLHVVREYNAAADSLAGEALEAKVSKVVLSEERKKELSELNRIQEVIYESAAEEPKANQPESRNFVQIANGNTSLPRKTFADFVQDEPVAISVMTRHQKKSRRKRVRFADVRPSGSNEDLDEAIPTSPDNSSEEVQALADNGAILTSPDNSNEESQTLPTIPNTEDIDLGAAQNERRRRIAKDQEEELKWANLKAVLRGNSAKLGYKAARDAWKVMDQFVLSEDEVLYYEGKSRRKRNDEQAEIALRLVVPTTMVQEVLQNCHDALEGAHQGVVRTYQRVKLDYFWIGLYADVEKHVRPCPDCSSSKSRPYLRGHSPGNILAELPFQLVSMDFVIPLPTTRRGNAALLLFQCSFTGFVIAKAMSNTDALRVTQTFDECVYRRFGAPSLIRHDRDPRFMSEVFQSFAKMMQSKSRATLSYRPQANGQQERSVKTVIQSVRVYAEDPLQQDWDEIVERLVFAINTSMDTTRRETPFYLVDGWDARSTLRAMTSSLRRGTAKQSDALAWRREVNRQQEIALEMAKAYQATEKARRAKEHNDTLSRQERATTTQTRPSDTPTGPHEQAEDLNNVARSPKPRFEVGNRAWLYMERVKPGLTKKLAHRWHGPFRIKKKVEEYAYELELPDRSEHTRLGFDEELLPEDSWEPDPLAGEYEIETILDDKTPLSTCTERPVREFLVKWVGYDEPTWEPASNLSCGGLVYDYLRHKRSEQRFQMVQVADED
ncbi:unnamed protein product [Phytophthora fragariaefolia]|uniref:Unnamed protein product n=1 Tax=Phytophthora fragariaefolia TaxID=1490495 RepID=A0A9W6TZ24_9STRA|nr:unnamed protein product [Phytophthora fragariaefolia]